MNGTVVFSIWSKILFQCDVIPHTKNENTQKAVSSLKIPENSTWIFGLCFVTQSKSKT